MDMNTKTTGTKTGAPQAFREMTEKGTTQAKETYEKMSVASTEAADLIQNSYLTAVKGVQDYNNKFFEFAHENTNAAFDFIQKMSGVRSPSAFVELSTEHARKQFELLTEQAKELATLAQKATLATAEPLKTALKPFGPLKLAEDEPCGSANREFPSAAREWRLGGVTDALLVSLGQVFCCQPAAFAITDFAITDSLSHAAMAGCSSMA